MSEDTAPNYRIPSVCVECRYGIHLQGNPYDFTCMKHDFSANEIGTCDDFIEGTDEDRQAEEAAYLKKRKEAFNP